MNHFYFYYLPMLMFRMLKLFKSSLFKSISACSTTTHTRYAHTAYNLNNYRSLISIKGPDAAKFLQGLITNDIYHLNSVDHQVEYSMVLNNRGRVMLDVLVYYIKSENFLVEVDSTQVDNAIKLFNLFKIKRKIELNDTKNEYQLYSISPSQPPTTTENENIDLKFTNKTNIILHHADPRYKALGVRLILKNDGEKISDIVADTNESANLNEYKKHLYENGIAEGAEVFTYGNSIPLEYNIVFLNGVSFNKGCYLGQELVAKTHHTGVIRKRIMPLELINNPNNLNVESKVFSKDNVILNTKSGQSIGKLKALNDNKGLALVRLAHIDNRNMAIVDSAGTKHPIRVHIPKYWQLDEALQNELKTAHLE